MVGVDRRSAAQSGTVSGGGIDPAGRLVTGVDSVALSPPPGHPRSRRGAHMSARLGSLAVSFLAILLAAGCASMSGLSTQASLQNADALAADKSLAGTAASSTAWPAGDWWRTFEDAQLDQLIDEALSGSPTLQVAAARTRKALPCADTARAPLYPRAHPHCRITRERLRAKV